VRALAIAILLALTGVAGADEQPRKQRQHEILRERPSGFWTSNRPAEGGRYRWRLLGIGAVIAAGMGYVIIRTLRTTKPKRTFPSNNQS
jgi:hypothetical protein